MSKRTQKAEIAQLRKQMSDMKIKNKNKKKSNATPFRDVGGIIGKRLADITGFTSAGGIGKWLGTGIGSIFGSGDYTTIGPQPGYNVLSGQVPKFSTTHATNIVCHREYLGDVTGSTAFTNLQYALNPGMSETFPWLSSIAANYQQYVFHGLIFEFRPLITDFITGGSPGVIVLTTNYNADQQAYSSRQEAENAEFAVSVKPTLGLVHMIECKTEETQMRLYNVRTGSLAPNIDIKTYDLGLTQVITQNNPAQVLGELWVSYCVEFFKPVLATVNLLDVTEGVHAYRTNASTASPLGAVGALRSGTLVASITANSVIMSVQPGTKYYATVMWTSVGTVTVPGVTTSGTTNLNILNNGGLAVNVSGSGTTQASLTLFFTATANVVTLIYTGTIVGNTSVDLIVNTLDPVITI
jgi:hypothetical protein